jgi:tetratricopeptide (TPR) repeat protein
MQAGTITAQTIIMNASSPSPADTPRQLPPPSRAWVNRSSELAVLDNLAASSTSVRAVLTGVGGIGKTALAVRWSSGHRDRYPDGELFCDLSGWSNQPAPTTRQVLAGWLRALGVRAEHLPAREPDLIALYRTVTAGKTLLVVVDNAASTAHVQPLIPASATSTVLATSRYQLPGLVLAGFEHVPLEGLTVPAGARLVASLLGQDRTGERDAVLQTLATRCHGHPLALSIAGAYLATHPQHSPQHLITRLDADRGRTLVLTVEEASVGGALDMTYNDLDADTAQLFRLLSAHPGPEFTADPLAAAMDTSADAVQDGVDRLLLANLITAISHDRYRLPDLLQAHSLALAEQHDNPRARRAAQRTMIEWYLCRTAAADLALNPLPRRFSPVYHELDADVFPDPDHAQAWFDVERTNVLASQDIARQHDWNGLVFQFAEVVWNPLRASYAADDLAHTQQLGIGAARHHEHVLEAVFLARLGFAESNRGRHEQAIAACTEALERATTFDDPWIQSAALSTRARAFTKADDPRNALPDLAQALELDEHDGQRRSIALRNRRLGEAYAHPKIADYRQAIFHHRQAVEILDAIGDRTAHARAATYLAEAHVGAHQPDAALFALRRVQESLASCGLPLYRAHADTVMGRAHAQLGNTADAYRCYTSAIHHYIDAGPATADEIDAVLQLRDQLDQPPDAPGV